MLNNAQRNTTGLPFLSSFKLATAMVAVLFSSLLWAEGSAVTYKRPGVDVSKYTQFIVTPLDVSDMNIVPPAWLADGKSHKWQLKDSDVEFIRTLYIENVTKGIHSGGKYNAVKVPTAQTIQVDVKLLSLTPWAKKGDTSAETMGSGEMKYEAVLRDALNGDMLMLIEGVQNVGKQYQENTRLNHEHNLQQHFETWGKNLSKALAKAHAK